MTNAKTKVEPVGFDKIMYVCVSCREHSPETCGHDRQDLAVMPSGRWLCDSCLQEDREFDEDCEYACPPPLYAAPQPAASDVPHDVVRERPLINQLTGALRFILAFYEPGQRHLDTEAWKAAEAGGRAALARGEAALATPAPSTSTEEALRALIDETGSKDAENMADMARIGHACMEEIERLDRAYSNCPSEVIVDLANALDEAERGRDDAIATVLAADDTRQAATELGAENARLRAAAQAVLDAETVNVHVGYDNAAGGGNFVYADAIRTDDEAFTKLRTALSR
ncbi:hypothetical protein [Roseibium sp.]|uniref:hypothetical protein n=1 Tax=Roseibium sp. TaxID=1936156 RepID=UPI00326A65A4